MYLLYYFCNYLLLSYLPVSLLNKLKIYTLKLFIHKLFNDKVNILSLFNIILAIYNLNKKLKKKKCFIFRTKTRKKTSARKSTNWRSI